MLAEAGAGAAGCGLATADPRPAGAGAAGLDGWSEPNLADLADFEWGAPEAAGGGESLLHLDLRADNLLLSNAEQC